MPCHAPAPTSALTTPSFSSFHEAYQAVLGDLVTRPHHHINTRGNAGPERLNVAFQIDNLARRLPLFATRKTNVVFNLAEALWFLGGRDDLRMMIYYAPRMSAYASDGVTIAGAAYGTRLFRPGSGPGSSSAFDATLRMIAQDPDTKRAVIPIFGSHEIGDTTHPDVSCTIAFQLLLRDGALHGVCYMRANDAFHGLVSDVYSFTFIQELAARLLRVRLGGYAHVVGSMHIADHHLPRARAILDEAATTPPPRFEPQSMPADTTLEIIGEVLDHEQRLRDNLLAHTATSLERTGLPLYWQRLVALLEIYRQIKHRPGTAVDPEILGVLDPEHRWLIRRRWPDHMPADSAREIQEPTCPPAQTRARTGPGAAWCCSNPTACDAAS
ncbi:thymidylate synthase [Amycolatopsis magusensis]|uniref:thymidylate synthase n=1 Tax=Amycolatopsis magusensis TaxID=882444 RepID=A0ABS4PW98_9PSEU|nr:thymidylate synthase [Amycolatopsis magusensis]MBP2182861.1 thymidylate synthase [Amycolatopsis magusensis]